MRATENWKEKMKTTTTKLSKTREAFVQFLLVVGPRPLLVFVDSLLNLQSHRHCCKELRLELHRLPRVLT